LKKLNLPKNYSSSTNQKRAIKKIHQMTEAQVKQMIEILKRIDADTPHGDPNKKKVSEYFEKLIERIMDSDFSIDGIETIIGNQNC
jgi:hypothetical protein